MTLYADTSVLLPYYREGPASAVVESLFIEQSTPVVISEFARVAFASALARWVRTGELNEPQANRVESAFHDDVTEGRFQVLPVTSDMFQRANHWLLTRRTALRTLDSLQLACAEASESDFVTLDDDLFEAAEYLGIPTHRIFAPD